MIFLTSDNDYGFKNHEVYNDNYDSFKDLSNCDRALMCKSSNNFTNMLYTTKRMRVSKDDKDILELKFLWNLTCSTNIPITMT